MDNTSAQPYRLPCSCSNAADSLSFGDIYNNSPAQYTMSLYIFSASITDQSCNAGGCPPYQRPAGDNPECGLGTAPCEPWADGCDWQQYNYSKPGPVKFVQSGSASLGPYCHQIYYKNVQAARQWHGTFGWLSQDYSSNGYNDVICSYETNPGTASYTEFGSQTLRMSPDQTKFLSLAISVSDTIQSENTAAAAPVLATTRNASCAGSLAINGQSGEITSTLSSTESDYAQLNGSSTTITQVKYLLNGGGWTFDYYDGVTQIPIVNRIYIPTVMDDLWDFHQGAFPEVNVGFNNYLDEFVANWNSYAVGLPSGGGTLPPITDLNSYSGTATVNYDPTNITYCSLTFARSNTVVSWNFVTTLTSGSTQIGGETYTGTYTLSSPNTSADVRSDAHNLLSYWDLTDDLTYPFRGLDPLDAWMQYAPLVSRDEANYPTTLYQFGFTPYYLADYASPIDDYNLNAPFGTGPNDNGACSPSSIILNNGDAITVEGTYFLAGGSCGFVMGEPWQPTFNMQSQRWYDDRAWCFTYASGSGVSQSAATFERFSLSGNIRGKPSAINSISSSYQNYFDYHFLQQNYDATTNSWLNYNWGLYLNGQQNLPLTTTQMTSFYNADNVLPCAFEGYNYVYSDREADTSGISGYYCQKYCITMLYLPSQNFARPAQSDKFMFDELNTFCTTSVAGNVVSLVDGDGNSVNPYSGSDGIWGGSAVGGFWTGVGDSSSEVTLGTFLSPLPSDWSELDFGLLRYPNCPSIIGRIPVVLTLSGSSTTMSLNAPNPYMYIMNSGSTETFDLCNVNMGVILSNFPLTGRIDDSNFTFAGVSIPSASYVVPHLLNDGVTPGTHYYWDDTSPKGDFCVFNWMRSNRLQSVTTNFNAQLPGFPSECLPAPDPVSVPSSSYIAFSQTQSCQKMTTCTNVICVSPNGEVFKHGITYPLTGSFQLDESYGGVNIIQILQNMTELYAQTPHKPCNSAGSNYANDNFYCSTNGTPPNTIYYASPTQVEFRITLPTNGGWGRNEPAPTPPSSSMNPNANIQLGFISPIEFYNNGGVGDSIFEPAPQGYSNTGDNISTQIQRACDCVADEGTFAEEYSVYNCNDQ